MNDIIVSIVIPVYKTEKYLAKCMDSVVKQNYPQIEIVLVDDGSPDNCPMLCDEYAEKYDNIKVLHQTNRGIGLSRNSGIKASVGKYIFFLDSDDCLDDANTISELVECAEREQSDIAVGGFRRFNENDVSEVNVHHLHGGDYTKTVDFRFKGFYMYGHLAYNWGKLYRKTFLEENELYCDAYPFMEDKALNMRCYAYNPVYAFISDSVYRYRVNEESVTFRYKTNYMTAWISIASDFETFLQERKINEDYYDLMYFHIFFGSFFLAKQELDFKEKGIREAAKVLKEYGKQPFVKKSMKGLAKGKYLNQIEPFSWKFVIWAASTLFCMHGYWLMALGIALIRKMEIDSKITKSRYKKKEK